MPGQMAELRSQLGDRELLAGGAGVCLLPITGLAMDMFDVLCGHGVLHTSVIPLEDGWAGV
jgi:hypothetical protein